MDTDALTLSPQYAVSPTSLWTALTGMSQSHSTTKVTTHMMTQWSTINFLIMKPHNSAQEITLQSSLTPSQELSITHQPLATRSERCTLPSQTSKNQLLNLQSSQAMLSNKKAECFKHQCRSSRTEKSNSVSAQETPLRDSSVGLFWQFLWLLQFSRSENT